ncbi:MULTISPECIES: sodium/glutamate symporter [Moraxella]|uniref:Sodium/glutamate symporter n=1 Tax=Moraxella lacunata TaxID=477 RepID=A0A1B8Q3M7_MORLA|nr:MULTISPECIES: sodium/glutamate symporter [Moraxella]MBE9578485.1 sodium/glutamate symporter [Moraxella sp. K1664]MBE9587522.1 sodium/glutamate symporter [Moraxella sp. K1630]MBE9590144.1 sodium/glutamate symporter [Moraxella sp. K127]MBE9595983.1 sodium/glutamate symporter [Moraxella sp. K2450]MDH9217791.1 sodium/glutamate symporter [Moraxella lacunata]
MEITLNGYYTLILATIVLLIGRLLVKNIRFLDEFNIPEPVAGGLLASMLILGINTVFGYSFIFQAELQTACMLMFFASIGLSADFSRLKAGGKPLVIFTLLVGAFVILQNGIGVTLASMLGLEPIMGLVVGSISLTGGHGTAGGWGSTLETEYGLTGATTVGIATATYGLVAGGLIGGPVAKRLVSKLNIQPTTAKDDRSDVEKLADDQSLYSTKHSIDDDNANKNMFEKPDTIRLITASSAIETLALFAVCLVGADIMSNIAKNVEWLAALKVPTFVWALATGVILRNVLTMVFDFKMFDRAIDVFGNASLSLFLAMALMSLKLWELADLAGPLVIILGVQTLAIILFAYFVTFNVMGKDYDAAVLATGHCGFGCGATPTAVANMQAVTDRYGDSHKAFLIVPMVGAFFVDLMNVVILQGYLMLPFMQ